MKLNLPAIVALAAAIAAPAGAGDVKLQVANGLVTLQARDATVREILAEWSRVGQVKIVNAERVMGAPVTLDLQNVPESQALNIVLRSVSGYMAAPKAQPVASVSMYDSIVIMAAPRVAATAGGYTTPTPQQPQRLMPNMQNPAMLDDQDEPAGPPPTYPGAPAYPRGAFVPPQQQQGQPGVNQAPPPGSLPQGAPGTVSPYSVQPGQVPPGQQPGLVVQPSTGAPGTVSSPPPPKKPGGPGGDGGS